MYFRRMRPGAGFKTGDFVVEKLVWGGFRSKTYATIQAQDLFSEIFLNLGELKTSPKNQFGENETADSG